MRYNVFYKHQPQNLTEGSINRELCVQQDNVDLILYFDITISISEYDH